MIEHILLPGGHYPALTLEGAGRQWSVLPCPRLRHFLTKSHSYEKMTVVFRMDSAFPQDVLLIVCNM